MCIMPRKIGKRSLFRQRKGEYFQLSNAYNGKQPDILSTMAPYHFVYMDLFPSRNL